MALIKLANGTVHDPANGIDGEVRDIWIEAGKVVAPPTDPTRSSSGSTTSPASS
jgi:formylmethanofuran dehydrogenase subunit A